MKSFINAPVVFEKIVIDEGKKLLALDSVIEVVHLSGLGVVKPKLMSPEIGERLADRFVSYE